jgi:hypothetical protein
MLLRSLIFLLALGLRTLSSYAQVTLDAPIRFVGPDSARHIGGVADPVSNTAAVSYSALLRGLPHWTEATSITSGLNLAVDLASTPFPDGTLLRFLSPATIHGPTTITVNGGSPLPLRRPDGMHPVQGDLVEGLIIEVIRASDGWVLVSPGVAGCPPRSFRVNARFCIDSLRSPITMNMHDAMDYCADRGGKLCRWDEFFHACSTNTGQMTGLFADWEWVDDTANHVHQGLQVARTSCWSQRSFSLNALHSTRCCYTKP